MRVAPKSSETAGPFDMFHAGTQLGLLLWETQSVIALRMLGMVGMWDVAPGENARMVSEKMPAFQRSALAAMTAAAGGQRPDQVLHAAVRPLRSKTRANVRRLTRRKPKLPL